MRLLPSHEHGTRHAAVHRSRELHRAAARAGDEQAQRIFQAHHRLLKRCVAAHDGQEVKWLGDGLMTVFASPADAVRCAVAMQQAARRRAAGERLSIRVGLNVGEVRRDESDYFGTPVVIARRLCDHAAGGTDPLQRAACRACWRARQAFTFGDCGAARAQGTQHPRVGVRGPVSTGSADGAADAHALRRPGARARAPHGEAARDARRHGGLVMLAGEPGIGKTRTLEEFAETARSEGALVLWGRCYEGEAARPVRAVRRGARGACAQRRARVRCAATSASAPRRSRAWCPRCASACPTSRSRWRCNRTRSACVCSTPSRSFSSRCPPVRRSCSCSTTCTGRTPPRVALLRHVARFAARHRLLLFGAYRDVEVDRPAPARRCARRAAARDHVRAPRARGSGQHGSGGAARGGGRPEGARCAGRGDHRRDQRQSVLHSRGAAAPGGGGQDRSARGAVDRASHDRGDGDSAGCAASDPAAARPFVRDRQPSAARRGGVYRQFPLRRCRRAWRVSRRGTRSMPSTTR